MNQQTISRISIFLLAGVMIVFGIYHFMYPKNLLIYVPSFVPGGIIWVYVVGAAFILVALSFILRRKVKLAAYLLAVLLFSFVLTIHLPNYLNAGVVEMQQIALVNLLKDVALASFALHIASNANNHELNVKY
jgi:putative oxidoreductase